MVTVEVEQASSVTTIKPFGRVLTDAWLAILGVWVKFGRPGYSSVPSNSLAETEEKSFPRPPFLVTTRRTLCVEIFIMISIKQSIANFVVPSVPNSNASKHQKAMYN